METPRILKMFAVLLVSAQSCETYYDFGYSNCAFHVNYISDECADFTLKTCEWQECVSWTEQNGVRRCVKSQTLS